MNLARDSRPKQWYKASTSRICCICVSMHDASCPSMGKKASHRPSQQVR